MSLLLLPLLSVAGPCDILSSGGTPCVAAHSMIRALFSAYDGPLYQLRRQVDNATLDIGVLSAGGFANSVAQDAFCASSSTPAVQDPSMPPIGYTVNIIPVALPTLSFRHCYSQGFVTPTDSNPDHQFKLVPSLNGDPGAISFQSINYPTSYIAPVATAEPGRLGIVQGPVPDDASWTISPSGSGVSITLRSRGLSMSVGSNLTGICASSYSSPSASVYLEDPATASVWVLDSSGYPPPAACQVWRIYDQSPFGNHLSVAGPAINNPNFDNPVNASRHPVTVGGHKVYGAMFEVSAPY